MTPGSSAPPETACAARAGELYREHRSHLLVRTDRLFAGLMVAQWVFGLVLAVWLSPQAWSGASARVHTNVWAALLLGALITAPPVALALLKPGRPLTRHGIAIGQMLTSALLIHITGGRIETHFHVFGSLAFLAFYRDWRVLVSATLVIATDHFLRGVFWPESVFGVLSASSWRWVEHAGWVIFENVFLVKSCLQGSQEMRTIAERRAHLELVNASIEQQVLERTEELSASQAKLREAFAELEHKNLEVEAASAQALAAARAKSEFLATMSHEIRTPLNAVLGLTGILIDTELDADQQELVSIIRTSGDSLLAIVNDVLDFSKIESGRMEFEEIDFDVEALVEEVCDLLASQAHKKGLELTHLVHADVPRMLVGDSGRLRQVILNLATNAVKFTKQGEVAVEVRAEGRSDGAVLLKVSVADTGIGIPEGRIERLFCAFSQVDASNTREFGGTGLGLVIAKRIVELHGGQIGVDSRIGEGSTFWFTVVVQRSGKAAAPRACQARSLRILVVDDNPTNRRIIRYHLERGTHVVVEAECGHDALAVLRAATAVGEPFDMAVLDYQMPEMDGLELAGAIKADAALERVALALLTSVGGLLRSAEVRARGFAACMNKPVRPADLLTCIADVASGRAGSARRQRVEAATSEESLLDAVARARARILVVEDNVVNQKVLVRQLQKMGFHCEVASDGLEAMHSLEQIPFDLVLMDCQMPRLDGYEATRMLREKETQQPELGRLPIVAITANAMDEDRQRCLDAGMDDYLSKPIQYDRLLAAMERWLSAEPFAARALGRGR